MDVPLSPYYLLHNRIPKRTSKTVSSVELIKAIRGPDRKINVSERAVVVFTLHQDRFEKKRVAS